MSIPKFLWRKGPGLGDGLDGISSGTEDPRDTVLESPDKQPDPIKAIASDG